MIKEWFEELKGYKVRPHDKRLFKVRPDGERELPPEEMASHFHCNTAQLLFMYLRARLDVQTAVLFLTHD